MLMYKKIIPPALLEINHIQEKVQKHSQKDKILFFLLISAIIYFAFLIYFLKTFY
jgi:hypothetical protein